MRKITERQATAGQTPSRQAERLYLNGFELYREFANDGQSVTLARETVHVMDDQQRIALIETRTVGSDPAPPQIMRYQCGNHLGSAGLELDGQAQIISYEEYTPYGSTSYQAVRSQTETPKRYRYTGKERDEENGLYYHGARYYAPWLGRWTACDPAILASSNNEGARADQSYVYAANRPIVASDPDGRVAWLAVVGAVLVTGLTVVSSAHAPENKAQADKAEPSIGHGQFAAQVGVNTATTVLGGSLFSGVKSRVLSWTAQGAVGGGSGAVLGKAVTDVAQGHSSSPGEYAEVGVTGAGVGAATGLTFGVVKASLGRAVGAVKAWRTSRAAAAAPPPAAPPPRTACCASCYTTACCASACLPTKSSVLE